VTRNETGDAGLVVMQIVAGPFGQRRGSAAAAVWLGAVVSLLLAGPGPFFGSAL
jgi:hypothetical protein